MPAGMKLNQKTMEAHLEAKKANEKAELERIKAVYRRTGKIQQFQRPSFSTPPALGKEQQLAVAQAVRAGAFNVESTPKRTVRRYY